jgi:protein TonB
MFADALLDSHHQSRRGWATVTSFGVQAVLIAGLLIVPLFYTQVLPHLPTSEVITMPVGPAPIVHAEPIPHSGGTVSQNLVVGQIIRVPSSIRNGIDRSLDGDSPNPLFIGESASYAGAGGDPRIGVIGSFGGGRVPTLQQEQAKPRISVIMEGSLIHRLEPVYPPLAKTARIQGKVLLEAVIGKDGSVKNLQVISGPPMLVQSARDAVRQWRYRPYILNGEPIEVDTQISVNFILSR